MQDTIPPSNLYDPDHAVADSHALSSVAAPVLREVIAQGAAVLARCEASVGAKFPPPQDPHLAVLLCLHQELEALDAANELLRIGRAAGAIPSLRSAFESVLSIEFLLADDTERRGYAYLVTAQKDRLRLIEQLTPGTERRKHVEALAKRDRFFQSAPPLHPDAPKLLDNHLRLLSRPGWKEAAGAWDARKSAMRGGRPAWYSLNGGPVGLEQLADAVGRPYEYEVLYRGWSNTAHGHDPSRVIRGEDGELGYAMIPDYRGLQTAYTFAIGFGTEAVRRVLLHYRDEEDFFRRWYAEKVSAVFRRLSGADRPEPEDV